MKTRTVEEIQERLEKLQLEYDANVVSGFKGMASLAKAQKEELKWVLLFDYSKPDTNTTDELYDYE